MHLSALPSTCSNSSKSGHTWASITESATNPVQMFEAVLTTKGLEREDQLVLSPPENYE